MGGTSSLSMGVSRKGDRSVGEDGYSIGCDLGIVSALRKAARCPEDGPHRSERIGVGECRSGCGTRLHWAIGHYAALGRVPDVRRCVRRNVPCLPHTRTRGPSFRCHFSLSDRCRRSSGALGSAHGRPDGLRCRDLRCNGRGTRSCQGACPRAHPRASQCPKTCPRVELLHVRGAGDSD